MKSITEILNINESLSNFHVKTFIKLYKQMFGWDFLNYDQKKVLINQFKIQGGAFFEPIYVWSDKAKYEGNKELYKVLEASKDICEEIYKQLKADID